MILLRRKEYLDLGVFYFFCVLHACHVVMMNEISTNPRPTEYFESVFKYSCFSVFSLSIKRFLLAVIEIIYIYVKETGSVHDIISV